MQAVDFYLHCDCRWYVARLQPVLDSTASERSSASSPDRSRGVQHAGTDSPPRRRARMQCMLSIKTQQSTLAFRSSAIAALHLPPRRPAPGTPFCSLSPLLSRQNPCQCQQNAQHPRTAHLFRFPALVNPSIRYPSLWSRGRRFQSSRSSRLSILRTTRAPRSPPQSSASALHSGRRLRSWAAHQCPQQSPGPRAFLSCSQAARQPHSHLTFPPPAPRLAPAQPSKALKLPQARIPRASSSQAASEARREQMQAQLLVLVNLIGEHCQLFAILSASGHAPHHLKQLLAPFAASTLYRYISNCTAFADFVQAAHAPMHQLPVSLVVDFLYACSSSADQDRAVHRTSASSAVKSLRWLAKHIQWAALQACVHNSLVSSYCKQIASFDKREATPIPAALIAAWERILCAVHTPLTTKLILGAALLCIHSSIRFGDAQRVHWHTLQLSTQGLHAVAYATKTTKAGQPFACTWHGNTGRSAITSWLLQWLACIASLPASQQDNSSQPDFLFPHADMQCHALPCVAPASFARTLLCIRWAAQSSDICGPAALTPTEAFALTLRSMKSTALASAAQLELRRDDRLAQGHHRDSARLYSRNDTFASLRVQRAIAASLSSGWRPQRSMCRGGAPPVPEPPVSIPTTVPSEHLSAGDIVAGPW